MKAATRPPANAAPTRISGRSGGMPNGSSEDDDPPAAVLPAGRSGVAATTVTVGVGSGVGPAVVGLWRASPLLGGPPFNRGPPRGPRPSRVRRGATPPAPPG